MSLCKNILMWVICESCQFVKCKPSNTSSKTSLLVAIMLANILLASFFQMCKNSGLSVGDLVIKWYWYNIDLKLNIVQDLICLGLLTVVGAKRMLARVFKWLKGPLMLEEMVETEANFFNTESRIILVSFEFPSWNYTQSLFSFYWDLKALIIVHAWIY